jgi:hypothetical protein
MRVKIVIASGCSGAEAARVAPAGVPVRTGPTGLGKGLALENGGNVMRLTPIGITLSLRITRTGWSIAVRVYFKA